MDIPDVHRAAEENDVEALRVLLDADPGLIEATVGYFGAMRPLECACAYGSVEAAELLLDRGADLRARPGSFGPFMQACNHGHAAVVSLLLARGVHPLAERESHCGTALSSAARFGHLALVRLLIEDGRVPIDAMGDHGMTALWWACCYGHTEVARVLLMEGNADHTIADDRGETPMAVARSLGDEGRGCVRLLEWYEGELERAFLLSKARAVVDDTESIPRAPEKVGAKTEAEAQAAREAAAPSYLKGRVRRGEALPAVEVAVGRRRTRSNPDEDGERHVWLEYVVREMKEDLVVELLEGLPHARERPTPVRPSSTLTMVYK